ncbi:glycosyltransferase family 2 protein [Kaistella sp.]|uniref:glycosyltransferase family 2 protein n=1 Tax=Kaistella sp. TaxID=2782235 RepID=UPI0035A0CD90
MNEPKVVCIIVTYNALRWIEKCLSTISEETIKIEIIVVDNNSTDNTVDFIKNNFPKVQILPQTKNLGFSGANNVGYEWAKKADADYIYLLNQDTISYPNTVAKLISIYQKDSAIGVVSPLHLNDTTEKLDKKFEDYITAGSCPNYISDMSLGNPKEYYSIGFVNAAAWLISIETVKKMGGLFSSAFFHYGEDSNFLSRLRFHKKKCVIVPNCFIHHLREERAGKMSAEFEKKKLSIKKVEIMMNVNVEYNKAVSTLYRYAGQQVFKRNFSGAYELFTYPIFSKSSIKKIRESYKTQQII